MGSCKNSEFSAALNVAMLTSSTVSILSVFSFMVTQSDGFLLEKELESDNHPCKAENLKVFFKVFLPSFRFAIFTNFTAVLFSKVEALTERFLRLRFSSILKVSFHTFISIQLS